MLVLLIVLVVWLASCQFKDMPEYRMVEWKLLRIENGTRDNQPIKIQIWLVDGLTEHTIVGFTFIPVGTVMYWPVSK